ncbi:MAG TPA: hypothetical protein VNI01_16825, partial [Elusimicrobiota bacterium]|nr:hypothetical protein [Elusimicrobiota bacterium]
MRTLPRALLASWTLLLAAAAASAQITTQAQSVDPGTVPGNVNYQGRLQLNGAPTTGTYSMTFRIYTAASGGTPILTLGPQSVTVTQGIFGTTLALSTATLAGSAQKYLEVQVGSQILSPREPINAVPYAVVAKTLEDALSIGTATVSGVLYSSGTLRASTVSSLTGLSGVTVSTSLFIANGNLGVGTTTPLARLHVGGTAGVDGIMFPDGSIQTSAGIGSVGAVSNIGDARITGDSDLNGTGDVILVTGSNERLRIANGGGIGIGTSLPAAKLHLSGGDLQVGDAPTASTISASGYFTLASLPSAPAASRGRIYFDSTANSGQGALRVSLDGSTFVPISTGSAGVGLSAVAANAAQFTGDGTTGNPLQLRSSSVTLQGNAFNVANTLVQLDASVRLPAVDGSQLLNISDNSKVAKSGDVMSGQLILAGSTLTVQGNAFSVGGSTLVVSAGSVGIGVSAPTARLHIGGAAGVDGIRFPDGTLQTTASSAGSFVSKTGDTMTGGLSLSGSSVTIVDGNPAHPYALAVSSGTGAGGYALYVTTAGTVGIGTTRPDGELDVNGNHFFFGPGSSSPGSSAALRMVPFNNSGDQNFYFELYNAARSASGNKLIFTGFNGTQQTMVVDAQNQAVGIRTGIATPAAALEVNGGVLLRSSATWAGSAAPPVSAAGQGAIYYDSTLNKFQVSQNGGAYADLSTGGGNFVSKTGDAMIGQLTIAGSSLTVRSSGGVSPLFVSTSATLGSAGLYVDGGNNVGIGTTSPTAKLHVQASVIALTPMLRLERLGGGAGGSILFGGQNSTATLGMDNNGTVLLGSLANFPIAFHTNATDIGNALSNERMRITETGNIGIGTSSPAVLFDVNGAAQFGSGAAKSTFTALGGLFVASGSSITLSGPNGYLSSASSVTASAFFGDGSHLTGIAGGGSFVSKTGDTMSGQLTINGSSLTVRSNGATSPLFVSTSATPGTAGLYVDGNNNVGVATTSPARSLDVLGAIRSSSTAFGVPALEATAVGSGGGGSSIVAVKAYASGGSGGSNTVYGVYSTPIGGGGGGNTAIGVYSTASGAATNYAAIFSSATVLINGDAAIPFQIGTSSFTITAAGNVVSQSSVTASAFFGDGSHLTGIAAGGNFVSRTGDTMSGSLSIDNSSLTVNGAIYSTGTTGGAAFSGAGTRFLWVPSSASIRAGAVDSTQWDPSSIGGFSVAFGQNSRA